jgi:hypothetical protein
MEQAEAVVFAKPAPEETLPVLRRYACAIFTAGWHPDDPAVPGNCGWQHNTSCGSGKNTD